MSAETPARLSRLFTPEPTTGCWLFLGYIDRAGYGQMKVGGRLLSAHRGFWLLLRGEVQAEDLDHRCRNRSCVNPQHLEPVTHRENMRRGDGFAGRNARKTHCVRGHEFTPANTYRHGKDGTARNCRECALAKHRARRAGRAS